MIVQLLALAYIASIVANAQLIATQHDVVLQLGSRGVLPCKVTREVYAVYWNKGSTYVTSTNLIFLDLYNDKGLRAGSGYVNGLYNITDDFSLIILDVEVENEGRYFCAVSDVATGTTIANHTDVIVYVHPEETHLAIDECKQNISVHAASDSCTIAASVPVNITCLIFGYYPNITLNFFHETSKLEPLDTSEWNNTDGTKSRSITIFAAPSVQWYICVATHVLAGPGDNEKSVEILVLPTTSTIPPVTQSMPAKSGEASAKWAAAFMLVPVCGFFLIIIWRHRRRARKRKSLTRQAEMEMPLMEGESQFQCSKHEENVAIIFCVTCNNQPFCATCVDMEHNNHHLLSANWEKGREDFLIPDQKRGSMSGLLSLKDGRLAISYGAYGKGGIDLLSVENNRTSRILPNKVVQYMDQLPDNNIVICDEKWINEVYDLGGKLCSTPVNIDERRYNVSLRISNTGNIILGHTEKMEISEYNIHDGTQIGESIETTIEPWQILLLPDDKMCISCCTFGVDDPVHLINRKSGKCVPLITDSSGVCPFVTRDSKGNIFIVTVCQKKQMSISKFSSDGKRKEDILFRKKVNPKLSGYATWLEIACLSDDLLAVADQDRISFYRKRPSSTSPDEDTSPLC